MVQTGIRKDRKKFPVARPEVLPKKIVIPAAQHNPPHNLKMLTEKHNDELLAIIILIVQAGLLAYHFW